jgi:hypothetical protein
MTALNFLVQSPVDPEYLLLVYLRDYKLPMLDKYLQQSHFGNEVKIKHIIQVYQCLEHAVAPILVKQINKDYQKPLIKDQKSYMSFMLRQHYYLVSPVMKAM